MAPSPRTRASGANRIGAAPVAASPRRVRDPAVPGIAARRDWARVAIALVLVVLVLAAAGTAAYAYFVEPHRIEVTRHVLSGNVRRPLRIAHVSDVHARGFGARERALVALVRRENPDLIVLTGDTAGDGGLGGARDLLVNLSAPLGVWLVRGDHERFALRDEDRAFYASLGLRFLVNGGQAARDDLWIAGLDDALTGRPDLGRALAGAPAGAFKLVLMHAPDPFQSLAGSFDLALAGHTHGGQVVLPGFGPLSTPEGGRRYLRGWFTRNGSQLFVSRGVGTTVAPLRLLARPELAIIDVRPR